MSKRGRSRVADDITGLVALLPPWAGVALAAVAWLALHQLASRPAAPALPHAGQIGGFVRDTMVHALATIGQYVLPLLCLVGAATSAWRRHERRQLVVDVARNRATNALDGIGWQAFEMLVGEAFRRRGYRVLETGGGGADGGVDLVLHKSGDTHLVQCKHWKAHRVGVDTVRELYGVMAARGAASGFVLTSGRFTVDAMRFAEGRNLRLVDGPQLRVWIEQVAAGRAAAEARWRQAEGGPVPTGPEPVVRDASAEASVPGCPSCTQPMVRRSARRGAHAGRSFWGCSAYPACKGTREIQ